MSAFDSFDEIMNWVTQTASINSNIDKNFDKNLESYYGDKINEAACPNE